MRKRKTLLVGITVMMVIAGFALPAAAQHTPDANTVLLDAFDGATQGEEHGTINYAPSLPRLGQAVDLEPGDWVKYAVGSAGWTGQQGTMEAWIYPDTYNYSIALLQWFNTNTSPPSGYVGHFIINGDGYLRWSSWGPPWPSDVALGSTVIPLGEWTHVAATWGSEGTRLYVNGVVDFSSPQIHAPLSPQYVYVNGWGTYDHGLMDEFRISSVPRSEEEIRSYVGETMIIPVDVDVKPGGDPNCVNSNGHGVIPVAILSTADFDATEVDPATVALDGQPVRTVGKQGKLQAHIEDVTGDGLDDLVVQIQDVAGTYDETSTLAMLTGATFGGLPVQGTDSICLVP